MDRRGFLKKNGGSLLLGAAVGAVAGAAGTATLRGRQAPPPAKRQPGNVSYAQQGEDLVLWQIAYHALGIKAPTYLDIGAYDPVIASNTYVFYLQGLRGVLVEPNPAQWDALASVRPRDVLLRAGIGASAQREADYYVLSGSSQGLNTFSKEDADNAVARSNGRVAIEKVLRMPLLDVNAVMQEHFGGAPTVLSVDAEGFDLRILRAIDFKRFRPPVVCAETLVFGTRRMDPAIGKFMASQDYEARGGSFVNTVFVDRKRLA
jgi:hypothetical protein